jgi:hypothetical protein
MSGDPDRFSIDVGDDPGPEAGRSHLERALIEMQSDPIYGHSYGSPFQTDHFDAAPTPDEL